MRGRDERVGGGLFDTTHLYVECGGEAETALLGAVQADLGNDGRIAETDLLSGGDGLQRGVEAGGPAGGEELFGVRRARPIVLSVTRVARARERGFGCRKRARLLDTTSGLF